MGPKAKKKLVFYVDTECSFSSKGRCSYYSSEETRKKTGHTAKEVWGRDCCPIVYLQSRPRKFTAFCPTRGGAWGEQLPDLGGPGPNAVRVEVKPHEGESWEEIVERRPKPPARPVAAHCKR